MRAACWVVQRGLCARPVRAFAGVAVGRGFSAQVKKLLDEIRERGITDLRVFTDVHPEFVARCMSEIQRARRQSATRSICSARADKATLLERTCATCCATRWSTHFREQLIDLWDGKLFQLREVVN